eukprot:100328_1
MCDGYHACSHTTKLYAYYANEVHVIANKEGSTSLSIAAYYVNDVRVTAKGIKALAFGSLFADYAQSVTIECWTGSCYYFYFYLPAHATVICNEAHCLLENRYFVENGVQNLSFKNLSTADGC